MPEGEGGHKWGKGNVLKLDWGAGYRGVYICQNSLNFALKIGAIRGGKLYLSKFFLSHGFYLFIYFGRATWLAGSQFHDQGLNPGHSSESPES